MSQTPQKSKIEKKKEKKKRRKMQTQTGGEGGKGERERRAKVEIKNSRAMDPTSVTIIKLLHSHYRKKNHHWSCQIVPLFGAPPESTRVFTGFISTQPPQRRPGPEERREGRKGLLSLSLHSSSNVPSHPPPLLLSIRSPGP